MACTKSLLIITLVGIAAANPAMRQSFWKGTPLDGMVEEMRSNCDSGTDSMACLKVKVMSFLDNVMKKDSFQITDDIEIKSNGNDISARSQGGVLDEIENYVQTHDVTFNVPIADAKVTVSPRNINDDELSLKIKFPSAGGARSVEEARRSKLKRIAIPIMVFVLLKAMTLIPLALGVLGLKAWNALQLGFFSFVVSVGLAIFQLCKKLAADNHHHHPHIAAHGPWDGRSFAQQPAPVADAQDLAYNAYA